VGEGHQERGTAAEKCRHGPPIRATADQHGTDLLLREARKRELIMSTANSQFAIPPGDSNYEVKSRIALEDDAELAGMMPHMHAAKISCTG
jgi:hypothetical protein